MRTSNPVSVFHKLLFIARLSIIKDEDVHSEVMWHSDNVALSAFCLPQTVPLSYFEYNLFDVPLIQWIGSGSGPTP